MGIDLKEKFKNLNKKNVLICIAILFVLGVVSICGYEFFKVKNFNKNIANEQLPAELDLTGDEQDYQLEENPTKRPSQYNIGVSYEKAMKSKKPVVALFYADWCGYCIRFMPMFQALSKIYADEYEFTKINVEDAKYDKLVKEVGITGFPTVFLLDPKYDNRVLLSNAYFGDMKLMRKELDRFLRIRELLDD